MKRFFLFLTLPLLLTAAKGADPAPGATILFDGSNLEAWEFAPGAWEVEEDGSLVCRMESSEGDDGKTKTRSLGYIWTKADYCDFELSLSYRLSEGANSGVFYRSEKADPVHRGFEVQLMDDEGFQKSHGPLDARPHLFRSRCPSVRSRSAFSLMKPAASFWS